MFRLSSRQPLLDTKPIPTSQPQLGRRLRGIPLIPGHALVDPPIRALHGGDDELVPAARHPHPAPGDARAEGRAVVEPLQPRRRPAAPRAVDDGRAAAVHHL